MSADKKMAKLKIDFNWPLVGHEKITNFLQQTIISGNQNHAYLFCGLQGLGKKTAAELFASSLMCLGDGQADGKALPCGKCHCCTQYFKNVHPDIFKLEVARNEKTEKLKKNISISQIKELHDKLSRRSFLNSYKIAIIDEADLMTLEAANSLLKILEEPLGRTVIILIVSKLYRIPLTIASRCQVINFLPVPRNTIFAYLEEKKIDRKKAQEISDIAFGRPGIAISLCNDAEMLAEYKKGIGEFLKILKSTVAQKFQMLDSFLNKESDFISTGDFLSQKLDLWQGIVRDLLLLKNSSGGFIRNSFARTELESIADVFKTEKLIDLKKDLELTRKYIFSNASPRLSFENFLIKL
ncbi:hypothetical protein C4569_00145 [Candidatus Parcubacteria bacterium]|nr:MAG: hypothetical protein C4569_00145 [Candidatus Parcubacteria bacterium]